MDDETIKNIYKEINRNREMCVKLETNVTNLTEDVRDIKIDVKSIDTRLRNGRQKYVDWVWKAFITAGVGWLVIRFLTGVS